MREAHRHPARAGGTSSRSGDFIALDNLARALSFVAEIEAKMTAIGETARLLPGTRELHAGLRAARHGRYLIFFLEAAEEIRIVRARHGARDLLRMFSP